LKAICVEDHIHISEPPCIHRGFSRFGNVRENLELSQHQFAPFVLYDNGALDNFVRGLSTQSSQRFDRFFSKQLTDHLFQGDLDFGLDLVALNIQRGRDHGLPPYNDWREVCGLPRARSWDNLLDVMDSQVRYVLKFGNRRGRH
jgi:peroxidase